MNPVSLALGAITVGSAAASAKARKMEGDLQAKNALQEATAERERAGAVRSDAEALRQESKGVRESALQLEDEAQAADYNKTLSLQNAEQARAQATESARRFRLRTQKERGSIVAQVGGSGAALSGSALDVLAEAAANDELDALTIEHEGAVKAIAFENDARLNTLRATSARRNATSVLEKAGFIERKADYVDQSASFVEQRAAYIASTAPKLKKAGKYKAAGEFLSGVKTLFTR